LVISEGDRKKEVVVIEVDDNVELLREGEGISFAFAFASSGDAEN